MADIELVIKIPKKWFNDMVREDFTEINELCAVIQHGTILPKEHGRLIDANYEVSSDGRTIDSVCGYMSPTIIEAESEE